MIRDDYLSIIVNDTVHHLVNLGVDHLQLLHLNHPGQGPGLHGPQVRVVNSQGPDTKYHHHQVLKYKRDCEPKTFIG